MVSVTSIFVALVAMAGLFQLCPAPPLVFTVLTSVAIGAIEPTIESAIKGQLGSKGSHNSKRFQLPGFDDVVELASSPVSLTKCITEIATQHSNGGSVKVGGLNQSTIDVTSVPSSCMKLATSLSGGDDGTVATEKGANSLQYTGVSAKIRQKLAEAFKTKPLGARPGLKRSGKWRDAI